MTVDTAPRQPREVWNPSTSSKGTDDDYKKIRRVGLTTLLLNDGGGSDL